VPSIENETDRRRHEFSLHVTLGAAFLMSHGRGTPEVEDAYEKALTPANQTGDDVELFPT
jgi:hypothetical protein